MNKSKTSAPPAGKVVPPTKTSWKDRLSQTDYDQLKSTFDLFDQDGGGTIDPVQVEGVLNELGLKGRSSIVFQMIEGLRQVGHPIKFDEFLQIICSKVGDCKSRDGITRVFQIWDHEGHGAADFESFKRVARQLGETMNQDEMTQMMHNAYILNGTQSHDHFNFEQFYNIVAKKN